MAGVDAEAEWSHLRDAPEPPRPRWTSIVQRIRLLPPIAPRPPIPATRPLLVGLSLNVALSILCGALTIHRTGDAASLAVSLLIIAALSGYSVDAVDQTGSTWNVNDFMHLGVAFAFGPIGCLGAAAADVFARATMQMQGDWVRVTFNFTNFFLSDLAAWAVFHYGAPAALLSWQTALIGVLAGFTLFIVQTAELAVFFRLAVNEKIRPFILASVPDYLPYDLGYGWAAIAFVAMYRFAGLLGVTLMVMPVLLLQGFLVLLARRTYAHNQAIRAHQVARERLLQQAIDASNDERERIASDIHDGVVQDLVGLSFSLGAFDGVDLASMTPEELHEVQALLDEGGKTAKQATRDLRTLMIDIAPPKLKQAGLRVALKDLLHNAGHQFKGKLKMDKAADDLSESQQRLVYRVAQEAVRNTIKYAEAQNVTISVSEHESQLVLTVTDDGKGFSAEKRKERIDEGHVGLGLLARTVSDGGGTLDIRSEPGKGTTVEMRVHLSATQLR